MREEVIDTYILGSYAGILAASAYNTIAELLTHMPWSIASQVEYYYGLKVFYRL